MKMKKATTECIINEKIKISAIKKEVKNLVMTEC